MISRLEREQETAVTNSLKMPRRGLVSGLEMELEIVVTHNLQS